MGGAAVGWKKLEVQLQSKLNDARIVGTGHLAKVTGPEVSANAAVEGVADELGMVPDVEELGAELEITAARFAEHEVLEEGNIPVVATGAPHRIAGGVAPCTGGGRG